VQYVVDTTDTDDRETAVSDLSETGAPVDKEISPAMVAAGIEVARKVAEDEWGMMLRASDPGPLCEFVVELYSKMFSVR
jgi:hypothetical protein